MVLAGTKLQVITRQAQADLYKKEGQEVPTFEALH